MAFLPKLDGVGPVDNRSSTNYLYHFVRKRKEKTCDMWHVTCVMWLVTCDTWWGVTILSKCQPPSFYSLGMKVIWRYFHKGINQLINQLMTKVFVEQPRLHQVCQKPAKIYFGYIYLLWKILPVHLGTCITH